MRFIKIPVIFDTTSEEEVKRFEEMGFSVDQELDVDFGYLNVDKVLYFWQGEQEGETSVYMDGPIGVRVGLPVEEFRSLLLDSDSCSKGGSHTIKRGEDGKDWCVKCEKFIY